ncbi:hypothetical protein [Allokutzneria sp. NRRL B-24872]|uniref:hypothetical protein n=1 Tax=Allokutzneria sp. NRRL B-24872 TaxID=1137961 RepID=UPI000A3B93F5|nr:hypothetical protein [Allokutzneria sp. NRRL B-24872]
MAGDKRERGAKRTQVLVSDLLHREGRAAQRPANQRTVMRAIGVAAGVVGVCGAIVAGTVLFTGEDDSQAQNTSRAQNYFTGGRALQPNLIGEAAKANPDGVGGEEGEQSPSTEPTTTTTGKPAPTNPGGGPEQPTQAPQPPPQQPQPQPTSENRPTSQPSSTPTAGPGQPGPTTQPSKPTQKPGNNGGLLDPVLDLLTGFFRAAPDAPSEAYEMLAPQMRSTGGVEEFRESWRGVRSATLTSAKAAGANTARVVVEYVWADGRRVRSEQRIVVTEGSAPRIADATVLSARNR